jgi:hypothetical protein
MVLKDADYAKCMCSSGLWKGDEMIDEERCVFARLGVVVTLITRQ